MFVFARLILVVEKVAVDLLIVQGRALGMGKDAPQLVSAMEEYDRVSVRDNEFLSRCSHRTETDMSNMLDSTDRADHR